MEELDDRFSEEAKMLARLASKASMEAVRAAWARGLSVTVLEDGKIVRIAPDGTRTFVKELDPIWYEHVSYEDCKAQLAPSID